MYPGPKLLQSLTYLASNPGHTLGGRCPSVIKEWWVLPIVIVCLNQKPVCICAFHPESKIKDLFFLTFKCIYLGI